MLHITRRIGETIIINNDIEITVTEVIGRKVKLGCKFPNNSTVYRKELYDKISGENLAAMSLSEGSSEQILPEPNDFLRKCSKE